MGRGGKNSFRSRKVFFEVSGGGFVRILLLNCIVVELYSWINFSIVYFLYKIMMIGDEIRLNTIHLYYIYEKGKRYFLLNIRYF